MIVCCSGEGNSDIGKNVCDPETRIEDRPQWGTMGYLLLYMLRACRGDLHESDRHIFIHKTKIEIKIKADKGRRIFLPNAKKRDGCLYFLKEAYALGLLAMEMEEESNQEKAVAILFHDTDPSHTSDKSLFEDKFDSIMDGFKCAGFERGVPMVPKPTSEAWVMAMLNNNCSRLEYSFDRTKLKQELKLLLPQLHLTQDELYEKIATGDVSWENLNHMISYRKFKERFCEVLYNSHNQSCFGCAKR